MILSVVEMPTIQVLEFFKWKDDTKQFFLLSQISYKWDTLGIRINLNDAERANINQKSNDNTVRCREVFTTWIARNGCPPDYPLTYEGLFQLLESVPELNKATQEFRRARERC